MCTVRKGLEMAVDCGKGSTKSSARPPRLHLRNEWGKHGRKLFQPRRSPPPACIANDRPAEELVSSPAVTALRREPSNGLRSYTARGKVW